MQNVFMRIFLGLVIGIAVSNSLYFIDSYLGSIDAYRNFFTQIYIDHKWVWPSKAIDFVIIVMLYMLICVTAFRKFGIKNLDFYLAMQFPYVIARYDGVWLFMQADLGVFAKIAHLFSYGIVILLYALLYRHSLKSRDESNFIH